MLRQSHANARVNTLPFSKRIIRISAPIKPSTVPPMVAISEITTVEIAPVKNIWRYS